MTDRNLLADLLLQRPAAQPMGDNMLARLAMMAPPSATGALPPTPSRDVLTMPTSQRADSATLRRMAMAEMSQPNSAFNRIAMGFMGPATINPAGRAPRASGFTEIDYYGEPLRILQNPSPQQMQGFMARTQYKAARRLVDPATGDVYLWDAGAPALHRNVADSLGIDWSARPVADILGLD